MIRTLSVILALLVSLAWSESQEDVYYRALKAEEAGDLSLALKTFEEAAEIPGPYTAEIKDIVAKYYDALGLNEKVEENPWEFSFMGNFGFAGLRYWEKGSDAENGGKLGLTLSPSLDYTAGAWLHSFGATVSGDYFLNNDDMSVLDTSDWNLTLGLEYSLMGKNLMLDVGVDLEFAEKEDAHPAFYGFVEYDFYKFNKQRIGAVASAYYDTDGPLSLSLQGAWFKTATKGWSGSAQLGVKFEVDSVADYKGYLAAYEKAAEAGLEAYMNEGTEAIDRCWMAIGAACYDMDSAAVEAAYPMPAQTELVNPDSLKIGLYWGKWMGPSLRAKVAYGFENRISLEAFVNLYYGFVVDGPDAEYEDVKKFTGNWGLTGNWKYKIFKFYLGVQQSYKRYILSDFYKKVYAESSLLSQIKLGVRWSL